jgi:hypothetical protein
MASRASGDWSSSFKCSKTLPSKANSDGSKMPASFAFVRIGIDILPEVLQRSVPQILFATQSALPDR